MSDRSQRTEKATPQRIRKARDEGRFPVSREFVAAVQFAVATSLIVGLAGKWWPAFLLEIHTLLALSFEIDITPPAFASLVRHRLAPAAMPLFAAGAAVFFSMMLAQLSLTQFGFATARLAPDFKKLNPLSKLRELPGQNLRAALSAAVILPLILGAVYIVIAANLGDFLRLPLLDARSGSVEAGSAVASLFWRSAALLAVWGAFDMFRQRQKYMRELRMTKQEIRDEWKQNEGSPEVKMRLQIGRASCRERV